MKLFYPFLVSAALLLSAANARSQSVSDPSSTEGYDDAKTASICTGCTAGVYLTTDSSDYHPGSTVNIAGGGFDAGETVTLQVSYTTGGTPSESHYAPWTVTADDAGHISGGWLVSTEDLSKRFVLAATGGTSSKYSEIRFTDATIASSCFINTDGSYTNFPGNDDGSVGPISLPFTFQLYGVNYTSVYVNNNGNITFGSEFSDYTASGFPITTPMIAPFWADVDTRSGGNTVKYRVYAHKMIATWSGVGYYNLNTSAVDSFQVIISDGTDSNVGIGNNVSFYFGKMGWTTGDASGGSGGFGGVPATVGINSGDGTHYIQVGRFGLNSSVYVDNVTTSGVHYLDYTCYSFNVAGSGNIPPSVSGLPGNMDTITCGTTSSFVLNWIGPEPGQSVSTTLDTGNTCGVTLHKTSGFAAVGRDTISIAASPCNVGTHYIIVSGTDNIGAITNDTITIVVLPPAVSAGSNVAICNGSSTTLTASGGASYTWSPATGLSATTGTSVTASPTSNTTYTVTGTSTTGCTNTSTVSVAVNSLPVAESVTGGGSYCSGGNGVAVGLTGSEIGVIYQLYDNGIPTGTTQAGTGGAISFGLQTAVGNYTAVATNTTTGCVANMPGTVTVSTNNAPAITVCPGNVTADNATGICGATVTYTGATATGTPTPSITYSQNSGTTFSVGTTNVTVTASNSCGTANCNFNVVVHDVQNPTITAPSNVTTTTNSGCSATGVSLGTPTTADNCSVAGVTNTHPSTTYSLGTTAVAWTVTDASGNFAVATQNVVVTDNVNPTITAPGTVSATTNSGCDATGVSLGTPTTADNCTVASVTNDHPSTTYSLGTTVVTWTVTDGSGNTATAVQNVVVTDNVNPTITAPGTVSATTNSGCNATGVSLGTPSTADNCSVASVTNDHPSTTYPLGTTVVTWTVTDGSGNTATAAQSVVVTDNVNPTITAPGTVNATTNSGCNATGVLLGTPSTADNCTVASVTNDHPSTTYSLGTTVVTWTVTDGSGNTATATQSVVVTDNVNPTITAPGTVSATTNSGCNATGVSLGTPSTADNCSVASVTNDHPSTTYSLGTTVVTWTVTDGSGNTATASQSVVVTDNVNPTISAPADITVNADAGSCSATGYSLGTPSASDNCSVASVTSNDAGSYAVGTHTITWTVTDGSGNTATATQHITVADNQNPTITAPANVTINGWCRSVTLSEAGASLGSATTADNCGVASVTNNAPSTFPVGATIVTWTATDVHGNTASATQTVTVVPATLSVATTTTNVSCNSANGGNHSNGSASASAGGGTSAYTYAWSNSQAGATNTGLSTGTYTVTVTDAHSCTATGTATVSAPSAVVASLTVSNISCNSSNSGSHSDGSVSASVSGGTSGYTYAWSNSRTGATNTGLAAGTYSVTVTDAHSCTTTGSATVSQPTAVTSTITGSSTVLGGTTSTFTGPSGLSYSWSLSGGDHICDSKCHHNSGHSCGYGCDHYGHSCTSACHHNSGHSCTHQHYGDHHCNIYCHHNSGHTCNSSCDHYGHSCTSACHHNSGHKCDHSHCGGAAISGSATGSSLSVTNPCCASTYTLTLTTTNSSGCSSTSTMAVAVTASTQIIVYSSLYSTGSGWHPSVTKSALATSLKVFTRTSAGHRDGDQSHYSSIWNGTTGLVTNVSVSAPTTVSIGGGPAYQYVVTVPAGGRYLVVGKSSVSSSYCSGGTCTIYTGKKLGANDSYDDDHGHDDDDDDDLDPCSATKVRFHTVMKDNNGHCTEGETHSEHGSLMLIVTPTNLTFTDSTSLLPVVYESVVGDWSSSVAVEPPYGFYATPNSELSAAVTDSVLDAVQFVITDTGSEWTNTKLTHTIQHKGAQRIAYSRPAMINARTNKPSVIDVVPNPAVDQVKITLPKFEGHATINVYNLAGQVVASKAVEIVNGETVQMDVSSLPNGVYMISAENPSGKASARLIKNGK